MAHVFGEHVEAQVSHIHGIWNVHLIDFPGLWKQALSSFQHHALLWDSLFPWNCLRTSTMLNLITYLFNSTISSSTRSLVFYGGLSILLGSPSNSSFGFACTYRSSNLYIQQSSGLCGSLSILLASNGWTVVVFLVFIKMDFQRPPWAENPKVHATSQSKPIISLSSNSNL